MQFFKAFFIRFAELLVLNCILSAIVTAAFSAGSLLSTQLIPVLLVLTADAVFLSVQWARLRVLCFEVQDIGLYMKIALSSFALFAATHFATYAVCAAHDNMRLYTWLFVTAKLLSIGTNYAIGNLVAAIFFELLTLGIIFLAPIHRREPDENERIPLDRDPEEFKR